MAGGSLVCYEIMGLCVCMGGMFVAWGGGLL